MKNKRLKSDCKRGGVLYGKEYERANRKIIKRHQKNGVKFLGTSGVYIDETAIIDSGAIICAPCHILGKTHICEGTYVGAFTYIQNSKVHKNATVLQCVICDSEIDEGSNVGPAAHLRSNAYVGKNCRIGNFVEIKNSRIENGCKAAHLSYIGDARLGERVNVGCGVVFANYDGKKKRFSQVEEDCFIGCNSNVVAPVHIKRGAYIAAGTTVCSDLEELSLCVGRCREKIIKNGAAGRYKNG